MFGESAGAASVGLHLFFPSHNLFHQAILQSGSPLNQWAVISLPTARLRSQRLVKLVGCGNGSSEETVECMRGVGVSEILKYSDEVVQGPMAFMPTIDGVLLKDTPVTLLMNEQFRKIPILAGSNKDEGTYFLLYSLAEYLNSKPPQINHQQLAQILKESFDFYPQAPTKPSEQVHKSILQEYSPDDDHKDDFLSNLDAINNAISDSVFICPLNNFLSLYSDPYSSNLSNIRSKPVSNSDSNQSSNPDVLKENPVYSYFFTQRFSGGQLPEWIGAFHGLELLFIFSFVTKYPDNFTNVEITFSQQLTKMWANFAKTGLLLLLELLLFQLLHFLNLYILCRFKLSLS